MPSPHTSNLSSPLPRRFIFADHPEEPGVLKVKSWSATELPRPVAKPGGGRPSSVHTTDLYKATQAAQASDRAAVRDATRLANGRFGLALWRCPSEITRWMTAMLTGATYMKAVGVQYNAASVNGYPLPHQRLHFPAASLHKGATTAQLEQEGAWIEIADRLHAPKYCGVSGLQGSGTQAVSQASLCFAHAAVKERGEYAAAVAALPQHLLEMHMQTCARLGPGAVP